MTGGTKAALIIALAMVGLVCLNVSMYRRMKAALKAGREREGVDARSRVEAGARE